MFEEQEKLAQQAAAAPSESGGESAGADVHAPLPTEDPVEVQNGSELPTAEASPEPESSASEVAEEVVAEPAVETEQPAVEEVTQEVATEEAASAADVAEETDAVQTAGEESAIEAEVVSDEQAVEEVEDDETEDVASVDDTPAVADEPIEMDWYILKVQSNRERSIAEALQRKIAIEGLDSYFGQVIVPTERVTEFKGGKKKVVERKLWPGYIVVNMHINDDTWFAVRETSGIGDFTGAAGKPTPMEQHEVARIIQTEEEDTEEAPKLAIKFAMGDRVKVKEGNFESFEGEVNAIDEASGRVTVMINIFGRSTPVELEYWQIEAL